MNPNNPGQRFRGPPNGGPMGPGPGPRPAYEMRNGSVTPGTMLPPQSGFQQGQQGGMSRAEKFEDEKKRIIESCFSKRDPDGSLNESYITHIRVMEDEDHPSEPPPPESSPQKKKPRVIMVAVRKSGRVRLHKGRENANSTFSIGKSWPLDDLHKIQSWTNSIPQTAEQREFKQRAQDTGFLVTLQKPYYWQAATAKEKDFFIFSLIKIYRKYTGGKLPEMEGFSPQELDPLGGPASIPTASQSRPQANGIPLSKARMPSQDPPPRSRAADLRPPDNSRPPPETPRLGPDTPRGHPDTPRGVRRRPSQDSHSSQNQSSERSLHSAQQQEHRVLHSAASRDRTLDARASNERLRLPGSFPSTDSIPSQSSHPLRSKRSQSPNSQRTVPTPAGSNSRAPSEHRYGAASNDLNQLGLQPTPSGRSSSEQSRPNGYPSNSRFRTPSQQPSDSVDERPRTATKQSDVPPALEIRSPKHRRPSDSGQYTSKSDKTNFSENSNMQSPEPATVDYRNESRQGRQSNRDHTSSNAPFIKDRSTSDVRSTQPPSQEDIERPIQRKPEESPVPPREAEPTAPRPESLSSFPPPGPETLPESEAHRPGLGPMIKKKSNKEIALKFRKAATAFNAFKPRGASADEGGTSGEQMTTGDGITGVFQAARALRTNTDDSARPTTPSIAVDSRPSTPDVKRALPSSSTTTSPQKLALSPPQDLSKFAEASAASTSPRITLNKGEAAGKPPLLPQDERRKKRRSDHSAKYARSLGVNPSLLEGRTFEIEAVLSDFGWGEEDSKTTFEQLDSGIRKELARVEAGSWLGAVDNNDERTAAVSDMMDKVMAECEELDCLLTLYNVELGTLSEDVAYIEAQSQGLQVQTANQKLLHTELRNLLDTISISSQQLKVLKDASLTKTRGIQEVENTLGHLFTALSTIDPKLRYDDRPMTPDQAGLHRASHVGPGNSELSSMQAVREKREIYRRESVNFIGRLKQYMSVKFRESEAQTMDALDVARNSKLGNAQLSDRLREKPKKGLWLYSPLMLFAKDIESSEWEDMMRMYEVCAKKPYQDEFREHIMACKRITRQPVGDESEVLFTAQEKENESLVGRKLTVKRTKTVRTSNHDRPKNGKLTAYESFAAALTDEARIIFIEQNFVVDFFHVSSLSNQDFVDAIASDPESRQAGDLLIKKPFDPNRSLARTVLTVMEEIFGFWSAEMQGLVEWSLKQDSLNGVGMLFAMESQLAELEETNQEFLTQIITKLHDRLAAQFTRFIEDQIRGIEDTKVKIKKRKGLIAFIKIFPNFSNALENMLPPTRSLDHLPVRGMVDEAYNSINRAMFESLKFIARESPTATQRTPAATLAGLGDPEDKEALNHHILLIENMHHYVEEVSVRSNPVLEEWHFRARADFDEHLSLYLASIIRRPLGKLLDFLESTETLIHNNASSGLAPAAIAQRPSHSKQVAKKVLGQYDGKEMRRGVETLRKRVEKHFSEGEGGDALTQKVWNATEALYADILERMQKVARDVYENEVEAGWGRSDLSSAFKR